jgi:hypothetical protein
MSGGVHMDKRTSAIRAAIAAALLIVAMVVVFVVRNQMKNAPKPPTPTSTVTPVPIPATATLLPPPTQLTCAGGDIFFPMAKEKLLKEHNLEVSIVKVSTFAVKNYEGLEELDCFWPGSETAYLDFDAAHHGMIVDHETIFRTFAMLFTRKDIFLPAFLKYEVVYELDGRYLMRMSPVISAMNEHKTWAELFQSQAEELGITFVEEPWMRLKVNMQYSAPEDSSGGLQTLFLMANYMVPGGEEGGQVVAKEDLNNILPLLVDNWNSQPLQDKRSPDWFNTYLGKSGSIPLGASSESLYIGWYNALPAESKESANLIVGIYPEWTVSTDHVLIALSPEGKKLVDVFRDDVELQQLAWSQFGMRTAVGGIGAKPGDITVSWIAADPLSVGEPKLDVFEEVKKYIHH